MNNNVVTKTTVNKKKRISTKLSQTSKVVEETIPGELSRDIDNVKEETSKFSKANVKENIDSIKKIIEKETLQDISDTNLRTSTPKKEIIKPKIIKKGESMTENGNPKMKNSENKSKKDVQRKERQKISKKNMEDKQGKNK